MCAGLDISISILLSTNSTCVYKKTPVKVFKTAFVEFLRLRTLEFFSWDFRVSSFLIKNRYLELKISSLKGVKRSHFEDAPQKSLVNDEFSTWHGHISRNSRIYAVTTQLFWLCSLHFAYVSRHNRSRTWFKRNCSKLFRRRKTRDTPQARRASVECCQILEVCVVNFQPNYLCLQAYPTSTWLKDDERKAKRRRYPKDAPRASGISD